MRAQLFSTVKIVAKVLGVVLIVLLAFRIYKSQTGPALHPWHTWTAPEMSARDIDQATFADYLRQEGLIFQALQRDVVDKTKGDEQTPLNRYYRNSLVWPGQFTLQGNRSRVLLPEGTPRGTVVLLHGLTDSPYSVQRIAADYQQRGFVAVVPRLPGHGTAPGALSDVEWEQWMAVTR
ncbi:MAG: alpha/beta hydrolase, partial [Enterobacteriaceae bacterium]